MPKKPTPKNQPALRYSTTVVDAEDHIMRIERLLVKEGGVRQIQRYFGLGGECEGLDFTINPTGNQQFTFAFRINVEGAAQALADEWNSKAAQNRKGQRIAADMAEQAFRTAWALEAESLAVRMAQVKIGLATIPQLYLGYMKTDNGQTVFDRLVNQTLPGLLPEEGGQNG